MEQLFALHEAALGAEMLRVSRVLEQSGGTGAEQEVVDDAGYALPETPLSFRLGGPSQSSRTIAADPLPDNAPAHTPGPPAARFSPRPEIATTGYQITFRAS